MSLPDEPPPLPTAPNVPTPATGAAPVQSPAPKGGQRVVQVSQTRSAPLPDPGELQAYKDISPELFDAIVSEFKENGRHRREMESRAMALDEQVVPQLVQLDAWGLGSATLIVVLALAAIVVASVLGDTGAAVATAISAVLLAVPGIINAAKRRPQKTETKD